MKTLISLMFALALISCGGSSGGGSGGGAPAPSTSCGVNYGVVGTWGAITENDTVTIGADCSVSSAACESSGKFSSLTTSDGIEYVVYSLNTSNGSAGCEPDSWACSVVLGNANKSLTVACENDSENWSASYTK